MPYGQVPSVQKKVSAIQLKEVADLRIAEVFQVEAVGIGEAQPWEAGAAVCAGIVSAEKELRTAAGGEAEGARVWTKRVVVVVFIRYQGGLFIAPVLPVEVDHGAFHGTEAAGVLHVAEDGNGVCFEHHDVAVRWDEDTGLRAADVADGDECEE